MINNAWTRAIAAVAQVLASWRTAPKVAGFVYTTPENDFRRLSEALYLASTGRALSPRGWIRYRKWCRRRGIPLAWEKDQAAIFEKGQKPARAFLGVTVPIPKDFAGAPSHSEVIDLARRALALPEAARGSAEIWVAHPVLAYLFEDLVGTVDRPGRIACGPRPGAT